MRIALISDIHANELALRAVLDDIRAIGADQTVCLGDVATLGAHPAVALRLIREAGCVCIIGNHDEFLLRPRLVETYTKIPPIVASIDWCRRQLSPDDLNFVLTFQPFCEIPLAVGLNLFLFHGSPRSNTEDLLATTPPDELDAMLAGRTATVLAGGHTHVQMLRQHKGMLVVNAGSVGLPFREYKAGQQPELMPHAEYAVVQELRGVVSVELRRVPLEREALRASVSAVEHPLQEWLVQQYG
jgi:predicted phosphodiesterase